MPGEPISDDDEPEVKRRRAEVLEEMPLPTVGDEVVSGDGEVAAKRPRFATHDSTAAEDPADPTDETKMVGVVLTPLIGKVDRRGKHDVCEAFSPPRMVLAAQAAGLRGGWNLDIRHIDSRTSRAWDLASRQGRKDALELVRRDKPHFVMLCPPCTLFCAWQRLRKRAMDPVAWDEAVGMVELAVEIAMLQMNAGRFFAFEHPLTACSWALPALAKLRAPQGIQRGVRHVLRRTDLSGWRGGRAC